MLLMEGAYLSRLTLSSQGPAHHVGPIALRLLESYTLSNRRGPDKAR